MASWITGKDAEEGAFWTIQQFAEVAGKPWYALQRHTDGEVNRGYNGYRHEIEAICQDYGIEAEELEPTTEAEFLNRAMADRQVNPEDDSPEGLFLARASRPPVMAPR